MPVIRQNCDRPQFERLARFVVFRRTDRIAAMLALFRHLFGWLTGVLRSQADLILENLALRQQLLALHAQRPRPRLGFLDRLFWVTLRRLWSGWRKPGEWRQSTDRYRARISGPRLQPLPKSTRREWESAGCLISRIALNTARQPVDALRNARSHVRSGETITRMVPIEIIDSTSKPV